MLPWRRPRSPTTPAWPSSSAPRARTRTTASTRASRPACCARPRSPSTSTASSPGAAPARSYPNQSLPSIHEGAHIRTCRGWTVLAPALHALLCAASAAAALPRRGSHDLHQCCCAEPHCRADAWAVCCARRTLSADPYGARSALALVLAQPDVHASWDGALPSADSCSASYRVCVLLACCRTGPTAGSG